MQGELSKRTCIDEPVRECQMYRVKETRQSLKETTKVFEGFLIVHEVYLCCVETKATYFCA